MNVAAQLVKKITPAIISGGQVNPDMPSPISSPRDLYDLFGIAVKTRTGHTDKGDWLQFVGDFEAITPDGEIFRAPRCHIPQPFEDMLYTQLMQVQATDPKASVQFAVRVSVVPPVKGKPSAVGYEYRVTPLVESRDTNPLQLLKETAYKSHPALGHEKGGVRAVGGLKR
jgi:hypothetical protein